MTPDGPDTGVGSTSRPTAAAALVALVAGAAYALSLRNAFAYDDVAVIVNDPRVHALASFPRIWTLPYWGANGADMALYRPLTTLGFAVDWALSGGSPAWFHFTSLLWHVAASVLVFLLLRRFFSTRPALVGAILFAVHPVHVEAVANVVGRAEIMASVFFLAACLAWTAAPGSGPSVRRTAAVTLLFALALLSKESAVMLPAALLLLDGALGRWRPGRASLGAYLKARAGAYAALGAAVIAFLALRLAVLGHLTARQVNPLFDVVTATGPRLLVALGVWPSVLRLFFFPRTLLADYGPRIFMPPHGWSASAVLGLLLLAAVLAGGIYALVRGRGRTALALLWVPLLMLPVSNLLFPTGIVLAERTLYLPLFALAVAAAGLDRVLRRSQVSRAVPRFAFAVVALLLVARTELRIRDWHSTESIFIAELRDRPDDFRAHLFLARFARNDGDLGLAEREYARALPLWPYLPWAPIEAAETSIAAGHLDRAQALAGRAARRWPDHPEIQRVLAATALDRGDTTTARAALRAGLRLAPGDDLMTKMARAIDAKLAR